MRNPTYPSASNNESSVPSGKAPSARKSWKPQRWIERWLRARFIRLLASLERKSFQIATSLPAVHTVKRILIVRTSHNLGDVVMTTALADECRECFPQSRIAVLVHAHFASLFKEHQSTDEVFLFDPRWFLHPISMARTLSVLRRSRFDLAIDSANPSVPSLNNWLVTRLSKAKFRIGFRERDSEAFLNVIVSELPNAHYISKQLHLLSPITTPNRFRLPRIFLTDAEIKTTQQIPMLSDWLGNNVTRPVTIFIPEPRRKCWPLERYLQFVKAICQDENRILLCFGPKDPQRSSPSVLELNKNFPDRIRILPPLDLRTFAAVVRQSQLFISNDCGPMHLAVAVGAPTIAVFIFPHHQIYGYHDGVRHFVVWSDDDNERFAEALRITRKFLAEQKNSGGAVSAAI